MCPRATKVAFSRLGSGVEDWSHRDPRRAHDGDFRQTHVPGRHREAVIDGHLIDDEPPVNLVTKLAEEGIHFERGTQVSLTHWTDDGAADAIRLGPSRRTLASESRYRKGNKPEDHLEAFQRFVRENLNQFSAFIVVAQRPQ